MKFKVQAAGFIS